MTSQSVEALIDHDSAQVLVAQSSSVPYGLILTATAMVLGIGLMFVEIYRVSPKGNHH